MRRAASLLLATLLAACAREAASAPSDPGAPPLVTVTIRSANGAHAFRVETATTVTEQARGLMYRTDIAQDGGMLFAPYPPSGAPREARFWMHDTPTPLDIVFIRADGTIARIAENAAPESDAPIPSGEPVAAVLELRGGRAVELGIAEGDRAVWPRANP